MGKKRAKHYIFFLVKMNQDNLWFPERHDVFGGKKTRKTEYIFFSRQNESGHTLIARPKLEGKKQRQNCDIWCAQNLNKYFFSRQSEAGHALLTLERHDVFAEKKQDKIVNYA